MASTDHSHSHHGHGGHGHGGHHGGHGGHGQVLNHETTDVSLTGITRLAILSFVVIFAILGVVYVFWGIFARYSADTRPMGVMSGRKAGEDRLPVGPLVVTDEPGMLRQLRTKERDVLNHYGWVDKNAGVVRIPIDRAIELLASQPQRMSLDGSAPAAPAAPAAPEGATPDAGAGQPVTPPPAAKPPAAGGH
jgi:hypothetical protein